MKKKKLSHVDGKGRARMVDIGDKAETDRRAVAEARVFLSSELLSGIRENTVAKGDVLSTARIAAIQAAKKTADIIPLSHTLPLSHVSVDFELQDDPPVVVIRSVARAHYKTGVEMEALTAVTVAALTIYDMGKSVDRGMEISSIRLLEKSGGRSGDWKRGKD
ncbi:MAG: cyclic pyranopterin monophosphate synthase MoaC [Candidatus Zixiibacteriota bacterium]|nr:MAG: cyclic pyranopterin monophosphate synthase MoaC [candidate division Zixibacteria bacterium]